MLKYVKRIIQFVLGNTTQHTSNMDDIDQMVPVKDSPENKTNTADVTIKETTKDVDIKEINKKISENKRTMPKKSVARVAYESWVFNKNDETFKTLLDIKKRQKKSWKALGFTSSEVDVIEFHIYNK